MTTPPAAPFTPSELAYIRSQVASGEQAGVWGEHARWLATLDTRSTGHVSFSTDVEVPMDYQRARSDEYRALPAADFDALLDRIAKLEDELGALATESEEAADLMDKQAVPTSSGGEEWDAAIVALRAGVQEARAALKEPA